MSITVALDAALEARVKAGEFPSIDAAVEEAVREFVLLKPPIEDMRAKIGTAIAELDRGKGVALDADDLKRAGRERFRNRTQ